MSKRNFKNFLKRCLLSTQTEYNKSIETKQKTKGLTKMKKFQVIAIIGNGTKANLPSRGAETAEQAKEIGKKYLSWRQKEDVIRYEVTILDGSKEMEVFTV